MKTASECSPRALHKAILTHSFPLKEYILLNYWCACSTWETFIMLEWQDTTEIPRTWSKHLICNATLMSRALSFQKKV